HMWMEVKAEKRVNLIRVEEALEAKVDLVGTGCPFCLAMVDLGRKVKGADDTLGVKHVSELVAESLEPRGRSCAPCRTSSAPPPVWPSTRTSRRPPRSH